MIHWPAKKSPPPKKPISSPIVLPWLYPEIISRQPGGLGVPSPADTVPGGRRGEGFPSHKQSSGEDSTKGQEWLFPESSPFSRAVKIAISMSC